jgi:hypothetical protein
LRHSTGFARSLLLNIAHTPDEPADIVRELAILFDRELRRQVFQVMRIGPPMLAHTLQQLVDELYQRAPQIDVEGLCERYAAATAPATLTDLPQARDMPPGESMWERIVRLTTIIQNDIDGVERVIPKAGSHHWVEQPGRHGDEAPHPSRPALFAVSRPPADDSLVR